MSKASNNKDVKTAWAITHWVDGVYLHTIAPLRREAIDIFRMNYAPDKNWKPLSPYEPNKAVKVTITGGWRSTP